MSKETIASICATLMYSYGISQQIVLKKLYELNGKKLIISKKEEK